MQQPNLPYISVDDYLQGEQHSDIRHEYIDGQVYAMAGAGEKHNIISLNLAMLLRQQARGTGCTTFIADMKLHIESLNRFYYPDVMLTCDSNDDQEYYKQSPCLVIEVLSGSTESKDRGEKLHIYQNIPSLKEYILVSQDKAQVEIYRRAEGHWQYSLLDGLDNTLHLSCLGVDVPLALVFEDVFSV